MTKNKLDISIIFLILANLVPIIGVLFYGWDIFQIIFIFWCESGIIGFFSILKILITTRPFIVGVLLCAFFTLHFGLFILGHLVFIVAFFSTTRTLDISLSVFLYPVIALFISHFVSFLYNFIGKKEYEQNGEAIMGLFTPYKRIILMQFVIVFGSIIVSILNYPAFGVILLISIKTLIDIDAHLKSHNKKGFKIFTPVK
jgi:hypothetical protein